MKQVLADVVKNSVIAGTVNWCRDGGDGPCREGLYGCVCHRR